MELKFIKYNELNPKSISEIELEDIKFLSSKDYFNYLCFYFEDLKKRDLEEFNYLFGNNRKPHELAYCQLSNLEKKQILN